MKIDKMKCIKSISVDNFSIEEGKIYDVHRGKSHILIFTKLGWFQISEYDEHLEPI